MKKEGSLKKVILDLQEKDQNIDLLIITHVDDDHIGGILKYFASNDYDSNLIKKVWFNSGRLINEYFQRNSENQNEQELNEFDTTNTSISQGVTFESKIESIWDKRLIKSSLEEINEQAFEFVNTLRLKTQLEYIHDGKKINNEINTHTLGKIERDLLKDSFKIINEFKKFISYTFRIDKIS